MEVQITLSKLDILTCKTTDNAVLITICSLDQVDTYVFYQLSQELIQYNSHYKFMWVAKPAVDIQLYVIKSTNQIAWEKRNHEVHEGEKKTNDKA